MSERAALQGFLDAQRRCVLAVVDGLDEAALRRAVLPSGWTPLGLVEHLGDAERVWFQHYVTGRTDPLPWPADERERGGPFASEHPTDAVLGYYRDQCARSAAVLASVPLDATPRGALPPDLAALAGSLREVALHMLEETARHVGHLDAARELIDGRTGLGPR